MTHDLDRAAEPSVRPAALSTVKILLEGTSLTKKTSIAFELAEHERIIGERKRRWHLPIMSSEWEVKSDDGTPTKADPGSSLIHFEAHQEGWAYELYDVQLRMLELSMHHYWILDRFHLSTLCYQRLYCHREHDLDWVDRRLKALGVKLAVLHRRDETFEAARDQRLTYSNNPHRYHDLDRYRKEQPVYLELAAASALDSMVLDISDLTPRAAADQILDWAMPG